MFSAQKSKSKSKRLLTKAGFTIVEMIVVVGIFAVLTAVIIFRYGDFNANILVTNMAYEVALTTRQAQVFGLGARGFEQAGTNEFEFPYGIFFNMNDGSTGNEGETKRFSFFVDRNLDTESGYGQCNTSSGSGDCTCATGDECIQQVIMQQNIKVSEIRVSDSTGEACEADSVDKLAITFQRPSPEARIEWQTHNITGYDFAQIQIEARSSFTSYVLIRKTGQISVSDNDICEVVS